MSANGAGQTGVGKMQYLLMIYQNEAEYGKIDAATGKKMMEEYGAFTQSIIQSGNFKAGDALQPTTTATTVRVSANGPSVVSVLPSRTRTVVAVVVGCKPSPALKWPLWMMDCVNAPYSPDISLRAAASIFTNSASLR